MRAATIAVVFVSLGVILTLLGIMIVHWRRYRAETDRYRAWQSVFGQRGAKVALVLLLVALATLTGALAAFQSQPAP
jgi:nitrate reductase gamma subunit